MRTFRLTEAAPPELRGASVALGNFDGVHVGHKAVIAAAREDAARIGGQLAVATFDPSPRRVFQPDAPPFRIYTDVRRALVLESLGVDACFLVPFDAVMAGMTDEDFARDVLVGRMGAQAVAVGSDFQFGARRMGDVRSLDRLGRELGFSTHVVTPLVEGGRKLSSTHIRRLIASGDMSGTAAELGRWWIFDGVVEHGEKRGRTLGYPTANLRLGDIVHPAFGVYAVWVRIEGEGAWRPGVASFGRTPTTGLRDPLLEAVLFEFSGDLYGRRLHVAFASFLRPELRFADLASLVAQMNIDAAHARTVLAACQPPRGL
jgi:riboflavin kinase / FMN adenylyltransferase